jgi:hypothetical protein
LKEIEAQESVKGVGELHSKLLNSRDARKVAEMKVEIKQLE